MSVHDPLGFSRRHPLEGAGPSLGGFIRVSEARIPDRLRAACAADAAEKADASLAPLAQQVLQACEKALPGAEEPLPVS